jgi:hypothetical protein
MAQKTIIGAYPLFTVPKYSDFHTVDEFTSEQKRLRSLLGSTRIVQASPDDTDTEGNLAQLYLGYLADWCSRAAWNREYTAPLRDAGLL